MRNNFVLLMYDAFQIDLILPDGLFTEDIQVFPL